MLKWKRSVRFELEVHEKRAEVDGWKEDHERRKKMYGRRV